MTPLELAVFDHCRDMLSEVGCAPTISELMDYFGVTSRGQMHRAVDAIVREGALVRTADRQRNLALPAAAVPPDLTHVTTALLQAELSRRNAPFQARPRRLTEHAPSKRCPAPGCRERVMRGQFYCRQHWFALPKGLRNELFDAIRNHSEAALGDAWRRSQDVLELGA